MTAKTSEHADQLIDEFKSLIADAEALIKATQDHPSETIGNLGNKALETISDAKKKISSLYLAHLKDKVIGVFLLNLTM